MRGPFFLPGARPRFRRVRFMYELRGLVHGTWAPLRSEPTFHTLAYAHVATKAAYAAAEMLREGSLQSAQRRHARVSGKEECRVLCAVAPATG
jgi:hypothetical protein